MKALFTACLARLNKWPKDLQQHFSLADNINSVAWIIGAVSLGMFAPIKWVYVFSTAVTLGLMLFKDCEPDAKADWRDVAAVLVGLFWSLLKIWLVCFVGMIFHRLTM
ncbi:MAG: hypothetical protein RRY23_00215 [Alistipes sp.]